MKNEAEIKAWKLLGRAYKELSIKSYISGHDGIMVECGLCSAINCSNYGLIPFDTGIILLSKVKKEMIRVNKQDYLAPYGQWGAKTRYEFCARMIAKLKKKKIDLNFK